VSYLRIALAGIAGAAIGWLLAMAVAWSLGVWTLHTGLTTMALIGFGPPGAFFGMVLGISLQRYAQSRSEPFYATWDRVLTIAAVIFVFIASAIFIVLHNLEAAMR
jgi:hypothetical protein